MLLHIMRRPDENVLLRAVVWLLMLLILLFSAAVYVSPQISLAGLGTTLMILGVITELNADRIWRSYVKLVKKAGHLSFWQRPNKIYYYLNVYILWPVVIGMGLWFVWLAYTLDLA